MCGLRAPLSAGMPMCSLPHQFCAPVVFCFLRHCSSHLPRRHFVVTHLRSSQYGSTHGSRLCRLQSIRYNGGALCAADRRLAMKHCRKSRGHASASLEVGIRACGAIHLFIPAFEPRRVAVVSINFSGFNWGCASPSPCRHDGIAHISRPRPRKQSSFTVRSSKTSLCQEADQVKAAVGATRLSAPGSNSAHRRDRPSAQARQAPPPAHWRRSVPSIQGC